MQIVTRSNCEFNVLENMKQWNAQMLKKNKWLYTNNVFLLT